MSAQPGFVPKSAVPNPMPDGCIETCNAKLILSGYAPFTAWSTEGWQVSDLPTVLNVLAHYVGSVDQTTWNAARTAERAVLSKRDFWLRLTQAEQMGLVQASLSNATIAWWLHNAQTADTINLLDPQTQQGIAALVAAGLLAPARATAILTP